MVRCSPSNSRDTAVFGITATDNLSFAEYFFHQENRNFLQHAAYSDKLNLFYRFGGFILHIFLLVGMILYA